MDLQPNCAGMSAPRREWNDRILECEFPQQSYPFGIGISSPLVVERNSNVSPLLDLVVTEWSRRDNIFIFSEKHRMNAVLSIHHFKGFTKSRDDFHLNRFMTQIIAELLFDDWSALVDSLSTGTQYQKERGQQRDQFVFYLLVNSLLSARVIVFELFHLKSASSQPPPRLPLKTSFGKGLTKSRNDFKHRFWQ